VAPQNMFSLMVQVVMLTLLQTVALATKLLGETTT